MIYTGYYAKLNQYPRELKKIAISRSIPKGIQVDKQDLSLAPTWDMIHKLTHEEYIKRYINILKKVDIGQKGVQYQNCILLCYESPEKFCHRHILAEQLDKIGLDCQEYFS